MLSIFSPQRLLCPEFNSLPRLLSDNFSTLTSKYLWERHFIYISNHFHVLHWHLFTFSTNFTNALDKNPTWRSSTNRQKQNCFLPSTHSLPPYLFKDCISPFWSIATVAAPIKLSIHYESLYHFLLYIQGYISYTFQGYYFPAVFFCFPFFFLNCVKIHIWLFKHVGLIKWVRLFYWTIQNPSAAMQ